MTNSDPNLHLLGENPSVEWSAKFGGDELESSVDAGEVKEESSSRRRKQVVSMIQLEGVPLPYESCLEVPGVELIPEEDAEGRDGGQREDEELDQSGDPKSPDSVCEIRGLINPMLEMVLPESERSREEAPKRTQTEIQTGTVVTEDGLEEDITHVTTTVETVSRKSVKDRSSTQTILQELKAIKTHGADKAEQTVVGEETELQKEDAGEHTAELCAAQSDTESAPKSPPVTDSSLGSDGGFQATGEVDPLPLRGSLHQEEHIASPVDTLLV